MESHEKGTERENPVIRGEYVSVDIEKTFEHWCLLLQHLLIFLGEEYKIFQELDWVTFKDPC